MYAAAAKRSPDRPGHQRPRRVLKRQQGPPGFAAAVEELVYAPAIAVCPWEPSPGQHVTVYWLRWRLPAAEASGEGEA
jgi:hypothetical protein